MWRCGEVERWWERGKDADIELLRCRYGAAEQRTEVQRCRGAEVLRCCVARVGGAVVQQR